MFTNNLAHAFHLLSAPLESLSESDLEDAWDIAEGAGVRRSLDVCFGWATARDQAEPFPVGPAEYLAMLQRWGEVASFDVGPALKAWAGAETDGRLAIDPRFQAYRYGLLGRLALVGQWLDQQRAALRAVVPGLAEDALTLLTFEAMRLSDAVWRHEDTGLMYVAMVDGEDRARARRYVAEHPGTSPDGVLARSGGLVARGTVIEPSAGVVVIEVAELTEAGRDRL